MLKQLFLFNNALLHKKERAFTIGTRASIDWQTSKQKALGVGREESLKGGLEIKW